MTKEIRCTTDYTIFQACVEQRGLTPATTAKIQRSMKKRGFVSTKPIIVNARMEVIDGQHRLRAAMNLGICVFYVLDDSLSIDDVRDLASAQANWTLDDYVTSHIRQGREDYARLRELKELSGLSWQSFGYGCFSAWSTTVRGDIMAGKFNLSKIREEEILEFLAKFELFKPLCKHWSNRFFVVACAQLFAHPEYDHKQMKARLAYQRSSLIRCTNAQDHLDVLAGIYNYKSHAHKVVDFSKR